MKAPKFWQKRGFIAFMLLPISLLYAAALKIRKLYIKPQKVQKPIICIGNLVVGGAGKTPIAIQIGSMLKEMGIDFAFLSRGYGGNINNFTLVNRNFHNAVEVGDEPLLLSEISNSFISKNKLFGAQQIVKMPGKEFIIMDDGLQNLYLQKDYSILVIDGSYGIGNEFLIPAGPLREDKIEGIKKANLIIIIGEDKHNIKQLCKDKKVIDAKIVVTNEKQFKNKNIIAFCGIGRPNKFLLSLQKVNCKILSFFSYPDHYNYKDRDLKKIIDLSQKQKAIIVTTKKDWVRLDKKYQDQIQYLDIKVDIEDEEYIKSELKNLLNAQKIN